MEQEQAIIIISFPYNLDINLNGLLMIQQKLGLSVKANEGDVSVFLIG